MVESGTRAARRRGVPLYNCVRHGGKEGNPRRTSESRTQRRTKTAATQRAGFCRGGGEARRQGTGRDRPLPARDSAQGRRAGADRRLHPGKIRRRGDGSHLLLDRDRGNRPRVRFDQRHSLGAELSLLRHDRAIRHGGAETEIPCSVTRAAKKSAVTRSPSRRPVPTPRRFRRKRSARATGTSSTDRRRGSPTAAWRMPESST